MTHTDEFIRFGGVMRNRWYVWLLLLGLVVPMMGCEADGEIDLDDDDASIKVDVDD